MPSGRVWPSGPRRAAYDTAEPDSCDIGEESSGWAAHAGTVADMRQGLASHILAGRRVRAIRGREGPAVPEGSLAKVLPLPGATHVAGEELPSPRQRMEATAAVLRVDAQMRVCVGVLCSALDWQPGTCLVLSMADDGRVVARRGVPGEQLDASEHLSTLDSDRRLLLPTSPRGWLNVSSSNQVAAVVCGDQLVLANAAIAWAAVAGDFAPEPQALLAEQTKTGPRRRREPRTVPA